MNEEYRTLRGALAGRLDQQRATIEKSGGAPAPRSAVDMAALFDFVVPNIERSMQLTDRHFATLPVATPTDLPSAIITSRDKTNTALSASPVPTDESVVESVPQWRFLGRRHQYLMHPARDAVRGILPDVEQALEAFRDDAGDDARQDGRGGTPRLLSAEDARRKYGAYVRQRRCGDCESVAVESLFSGLPSSSLARQNDSSTAVEAGEPFAAHSQDGAGAQPEDGGQRDGCFDETASSSARLMVAPPLANRNFRCSAPWTFAGQHDFEPFDPRVALPRTALEQRWQTLRAGRDGATGEMFAAARDGSRHEHSGGVASVGRLLIEQEWARRHAEALGHYAATTASSATDDQHDGLQNSRVVTTTTDPPAMARGSWPQHGGDKSAARAAASTHNTVKNSAATMIPTTKDLTRRYHVWTQDGRKLPLCDLREPVTDESRSRVDSLSAAEREAAERQKAERERAQPTNVEWRAIAKFKLRAFFRVVDPAVPSALIDDLIDVEYPRREQETELNAWLRSTFDGRDLQANATSEENDEFAFPKSVVKSQKNGEEEQQSPPSHVSNAVTFSALFSSSNHVTPPSHAELQRKRWQEKWMPRFEAIFRCLVAYPKSSIATAARDAVDKAIAAAAAPVRRQAVAAIHTPDSECGAVGEEIGDDEFLALAWRRLATSHSIEVEERQQQEALTGSAAPQEIRAREEQPRGSQRADESTEVPTAVSGATSLPPLALEQGRFLLRRTTMRVRLWVRVVGIDMTCLANGTDYHRHAARRALEDDIYRNLMSDGDVRKGAEASYRKGIVRHIQVQSIDYQGVVTCMLQLIKGPYEATRLTTRFKRKIEDGSFAMLAMRDVQVNVFHASPHAIHMLGATMLGMIDVPPRWREDCASLQPLPRAPVFVDLITGEAQFAGSAATMRGGGDSEASTRDNDGSYVAPPAAVLADTVKPFGFLAQMWRPNERWDAEATAVAPWTEESVLKKPREAWGWRMEEGSAVRPPAVVERAARVTRK